MIDPKVDTFLIHYGVKGMKWGQTTKSGKARNDDGVPLKDSEKSAHRVRLEAQGVKKGLSQSDAEKRAAGKIKTEKILAIAGGVALLGLAAYVAKQGYDKSFTEINLPAGFEFKNINALGDKQDLNRRLFTTINDKDNSKYKGLLAETLRKNEDRTTIYEMTLKSTEAIKAPSQRQAAKLYKEFITENPRQGRYGADIPYPLFNKQLVVSTDQNDNFYSFMKKKGYNSILDANDQFISGYDTKHPLILFNAASSTVKAGQKIVDQETSGKLAKRQTNALMTRQLAPVVGLGLAYVGGLKAIDTKNRHGAVNKYLKDHPDSKLSYAEVYANLKAGTSNGMKEYKYTPKV